VLFGVEQDHESLLVIWGEKKGEARELRKSPGDYSRSAPAGVASDQL